MTNQVTVYYVKDQNGKLLDKDFVEYDAMVGACQSLELPCNGPVQALKSLEEVGCTISSISVSI